MRKFPKYLLDFDLYQKIPKHDWADVAFNLAMRIAGTNDEGSDENATKVLVEEIEITQYWKS